MARVVKIPSFDPHKKSNQWLFTGNSAFVFVFVFVFFYQDFLSQTLTTHRTAGKGRGPSFIQLYHFHPLTNIQIFICNFACEMTITISVMELQWSHNIYSFTKDMLLCKYFSWFLLRLVLQLSVKKFLKFYELLFSSKTF